MTCRVILTDKGWHFVPDNLGTERDGGVILDSSKLVRVENQEEVNRIPKFLVDENFKSQAFASELQKDTIYEIPGRMEIEGHSEHGYLHSVAIYHPEETVTEQHETGTVFEDKEEPKEVTLTIKEIPYAVNGTIIINGEEWVRKQPSDQEELWEEIYQYKGWGDNFNEWAKSKFLIQRR